MNLDEIVVGKTIVGVRYKEHSYVIFSFSDGTELDIYQTQQAGALDIVYGNQGVVSDDYEEIYG